MLIVFVHGWSVTNTDTYGGLPQALQATVGKQMNIQVQHLMLAKYVSFADEVNVDDIARGMQHAVNNEVLPKLAAGQKFVCITHSTGGPVVRDWLSQYYEHSFPQCPMSHLIMLAPANHGSALAQLGKGKLARMKFFTEGVEPGVGVLDWLELGSDQGWALNRQWLDYDCTAAGLYVFTLTGQRIDRSFYDNLNSYTGEAGSDGVVRVAAANMNYGFLSLTQDDGRLKLEKITRPSKSALGILPGRSHSGDKMGILRSVKTTDTEQTHPTVSAILKCLAVNDSQSYAAAVKDFEKLTAQTQKDERVEKTTEFFLLERTFKTSRYCMLIFRLVDDRGNNLSDYDVLFTAGPNYDENHLPEGFFVDRQRNSNNPGKLTYYVDYDVLNKGLNKEPSKGEFGIKIVVRPQSGFAYYTVAEYKGDFNDLKNYIEPNQSLMIEVQMRRHVGEGVFQLTENLGPESFKGVTVGKDI
jgi:hypothetical protein